jgi:dihydroorotate dehydrogenase (fumarate)
MTLAATGGVHTAEDALKMLLAGADAVHMASALLLKGPQALKTVLDGLNQWMETHEYESVAQLKGSMSQQNLPNPSAFARAAYLNALDSFTPPVGVRY